MTNGFTGLTMLEVHIPTPEYLLAELDDIVEAQNQKLPSIEPEDHEQTKMVEQAMHIMTSKECSY